jgi:nucleoside-diphosphate kinase
MVPDRALAEEHYGELSSKPFFPDLIDYIISGPVVAMVSMTAQSAWTHVPQ